MRKSIVLLLVLAGCASKPSPQFPTLPAWPRPKISVHTRAVSGPTPGIGYVTLGFAPIQYPPDITPSNFCWRVQYSTNLATWQDWDACRYGEILVTNTEPAMFFRLIGTPQ